MTITPERNPIERAYDMARNYGMNLPPREAVLMERFMDIEYKVGPRFGPFGERRGYKETKLVQDIQLERHENALRIIEQSGQERNKKTMEYLKSRHILPGEAQTFSIKMWARYSLKSNGTHEFPTLGSLVIAYAPKKDGAEGPPVIRLRGTDSWYLYGVSDVPDDGMSEIAPIFVGSMNDWSVSNPGGFAFDAAWKIRPKHMSFVVYQGLRPISERHPERRVVTRKGSFGLRSPDGGTFSLSESQVRSLMAGWRGRQPRHG